jgi:hypothetical protein
MLEATHSSRSTPKDVFMHLLATIMLYLSVFAIISLFFSCINVFFPDLLSFYYAGELDTIRLAVSILVIAFPVYLITMVLIGRSIATEPGKSEISARKWLTYLTIFLAALMIIIDLITLLYNFLNGELSIRFFLKVLVVLIVAAAVFGYYLWDIRRDIALHSSKSRVIAWSVLGAVALSVALSFFVAGSPWYQRDVRFDAQRVNDLQNIQSEIVQFWIQKEKLPANLDALTNSISGFRASVDPETKTAYEYVVKGSRAFSLCAEFKTKSPVQDIRGKEISATSPANSYEQNWNHEAGHVCFERTIDPELYQKNVVPLVK